MFSQKYAKISKPTHDFKGYTRSYQVEILDSFNLKLQIKDTESAIKDKLIKLLAKLRCFKFVEKLVLEFKKIQKDDKTYSQFI